jgi:hypothetical protein
MAASGTEHFADESSTTNGANIREMQRNENSRESISRSLNWPGSLLRLFCFKGRLALQKGRLQRPHLKTTTRATWASAKATLDRRDHGNNL